MAHDGSKDTSSCWLLEAFDLALDLANGDESHIGSCPCFLSWWLWSCLERTPRPLMAGTCISNALRAQDGKGTKSKVCLAHQAQSLLLDCSSCTEYSIPIVLVYLTTSFLSMTAERQSSHRLLNISHDLANRCGGPTIIAGYFLPTSISKCFEISIARWRAQASVTKLHWPLVWDQLEDPNHESPTSARCFQPVTLVHHHW